HPTTQTHNHNSPTHIYIYIYIYIPTHTHTHTHTHTEGSRYPQFLSVTNCLNTGSRRVQRNIAVLISVQADSALDSEHSQHKPLSYTATHTRDTRTHTHTHTHRGHSHTHTHTFL